MACCLVTWSGSSIGAVGRTKPTSQYAMFDIIKGEHHPRYVVTCCLPEVLHLQDRARQTGEAHETMNRQCVVHVCEGLRVATGCVCKGLNSGMGF